MTQEFFYDGLTGESETYNGTYDFSESTSVLTMVFDGDVDAETYSFPNSTTLVIDGLTYFKQ